MRRARRRGRFMDAMAEEDPLTLMPNLFDLSIVLAVAFLLTALGRAVSATSCTPATIGRSCGEARRARRKSFRARASQSESRRSARKAGGQGVRLGVAYELEDGEVIYVPD